MFEDQYLDLKTLAEYSCLSVRTIREYLSDADNPIPSFCLKRKILVKKSEFDRWMEGNRADDSEIDNIVNEVMGEITRH